MYDLRNHKRTDQTWSWWDNGSSEIRANRLRDLLVVKASGITPVRIALTGEAKLRLIASGRGFIQARAERRPLHWEKGNLL